MYHRYLSTILSELKSAFRAIGVTGPRQSGKTTLVKEFFNDLPYFSLENPSTREMIFGDPEGFLLKFKSGAIFDEIQNGPELLSYLQGVIDESSQKGRFVITGSQNFALTEAISQSLAGRVSMATLLPLSVSELGNSETYLRYILGGGYPEIYASNINPTRFHQGYIQTYLERDVRKIKNINDLGRFQIFLKLCAGRVGQIVNYESLASDCGISATTARQWLEILQASYVVFLLQPYYKNFSKRLIKMPKLYFYDTGLACALLGIKNDEQLSTFYLAGALFENLVILEILKHQFNKGEMPSIYYWRDVNGREIDCIIDVGGKLVSVEIKMGMTFSSDLTKNLRFFNELSGESNSYLIYNGIANARINDVNVVPFKEIKTLLDQI